MTYCCGLGWGTESLVGDNRHLLYSRKGDPLKGSIPLRNLPGGEVLYLYPPPWARGREKLSVKLPAESFVRGVKLPKQESHFTKALVSASTSTTSASLHTVEIRLEDKPSCSCAACRAVPRGTVSVLREQYVLVHTTCPKDTSVPLQLEREQTLPGLGFHCHGQFFNYRTDHWVKIWTGGLGEPIT